MYKITNIPEAELPLKPFGFEHESGRQVFLLVGALTRDIELNLKFHGYVRGFDLHMSDSTIIESGWIKSL
ncbi:hypothetical protein EQ831_20560 [Pseudomonas sp. ALS1279]|nr:MULTISPECIES: hypothetical protein [unclassified Pseudomonas]TRO31412.1 hypothetical protein EQ831_20560 [Pseudomonas sp. ALS1279]